MLDSIARKIALYLGENSEFGVKSDQSFVLSKSREFLRWASLSDLLPYQSYDSEYGIFVSNNSMGFVLEIGLFIGSDSKLENELSGLFKSILPPGTSIQFLLSALPKVDHLIDYWVCTQEDDCEMLSSIEKKRAQYFRNLSRNSVNKFTIRDFRGVVSVSVPITERSAMIKRKIADLKVQVVSVFETRSGQVRLFDPTDFINYLSDILNYDGSATSSNKEWNKLQELGQQIIDKDRRYSLSKDGIGIDDGEYHIRLLSVSRYPSTWSFGLMSNFIGDNFNDFLKIPCSFLIHLGVYIENNKFRRTGMLAKASRVESQAASPLGRWIPALKREAEEWTFVREQLEKNERLVRSHYQVLIIDRKERITSSEQLMLSLYRSNGWELSRDKFTVMSSLLSMLPLSWGEGISEDMSYMRRTRTTLSYEVVNLLPLQGDSKGTSRAGMLFASRHGQLFYWYPFDEKLGNTNYNVSVVGRSGAGKSVFMQELATSILRQGGRVYVLDVGRSFEKQARQLGGQFIEFGVQSKLCLNPFSTINDTSRENVEESLSVLKPIISMMVAPKSGTGDYEDSLIEKALLEVWRSKGKEAGIGDVAEWFLERGDEVCQKMGIMLFPYTRQGVYGRYFNGTANINFESKFVVTELEELKVKPDLQRVVVQILMLLITNTVILGNRQIESAIIFDEAWDLLKGKQGGEFIEKLARTLRKYRGALVVGTQNLDDFYSSPGAEAAFMNSDWLCCLKQKSESISLLRKTEKFKINDHQQKMLESITTKPGEYAEVMIMTSGHCSIGRLILDPFSMVLYSTKPEEYRRVMEYREQGISLTESIEYVAKEKYGHI
ncbi:type IV secretion system protein TraC [Rickettsiales endosymbiont of Peranema trichophorum]|uniref:type IV secretion system protein TraC n=1 Tax=Rickettsiales endosymbiont of Peranema trichophorum TaxID=2486577 RepID=UPI001022DED7|nr:type IV secretion system protein TraC [Rickettsiales endosymbiont of Peranema trichophorum]RZI47499.1 type IV secretion system protein TraC [Rickettsiales endosymbiont of Peranema trichophorum]